MLETKQSLIDFDAIRQFLVLVVRQYEKSAPTVSQWADDLYVKMDESIRDVRIVELMQAQALLEDGIWEHPSYAANRIYHLMSDLKQDTTGHAGY